LRRPRKKYRDLRVLIIRLSEIKKESKNLVVYRFQVNEHRNTLDFAASRLRVKWGTHAKP
jgi:hypothetical protein